MLVALAIFSIVMSIVTVGISSVLKTQGVSEATTSSQAKLRRVTEVFTQELRSAVLGGITNEPYAPDAQKISFMLLAGGAGYQVIKDGGFKNKTTTRIIAPVDDAADTGLSGGQVLLVNPNGVGVILDVDSVTAVSGGSGIEYDVLHSTCTNSIGFGEGMLLFQVQTLGFSYDADERTLYETTGNGSQVAVAFDIDDFRLDYVYTKGDGTPVVWDAPKTDGSGAPLRETKIGGDPVTLSRIQMVIGTDAVGATGNASRTYSGIVELPRNQNYIIKKVRACTST